MASKFVQGNWLLPNNINANKQSNYSFTAEASQVKYFDFGTELWDLIKSSNEFSISWWCKVPSGSGTSGDFVPFNFGTELQTSGSQSRRLWLAMGGGATIFKIRNNGTVVLEYSNPPNDVWTHYVFSVKIGSNTADQILYKDGQPVATTSSAITSISSSSSFFYINQYYRSNYTSMIGGSFDEYSFFTRALSSLEVNSLYNSGTPGNPFDLSGDPIAYYKLGETAIGQAPGGTWNWQVPNHAQSQFAMQATSSGSAGRQICIPPIVLGNTHTFSIWIKGTSSIGQFLFRGTLGQWFSEYSGSDNTAIAIRATGGSNAGRNFASNSINYIANNKIVSATITPLNDDNWHNIIVVRTPTAVKVYIDGGSAVNLTGDTLTSSDILKVKFLTASYGNSGQWTGLVSNAALWTSDRSSEVANIYNNGEPQAVYTTTPQYWWKLDNSATLDNIPVSTGNGILRFKNFGSTYSNTYGSRLLVSTGPFNGNAASGAGLKYSFSSNLNLGTQSTMSWWLSCLNMQRNAYGAQRYFSNGSQIVVSLHPRDQNDYIDINVYAESNSASSIRWTRSANTALYDSITDGQLHCWLITRNAGSVSLYFDNNLIGTSSGIDASNNIIISNIGGNTGTSNQFNPIGNKFWDQFAFFNKELTTAERTDLYNSGVPKDISSLSPSYFMSAGEIDFTNSKFIDLSGNNLTLTFPHATDSSKYLQYKDGASVGNTMNGNLSLQSTDLGLNNPLYSQFSNDFNGTAGITTGGITEITPSNSICFWFNNSTAAGGQAPLMASLNYTSNTGENFAIRLESTNKLTVVLVKNNTYVILSSNTVLADNTWYFITLTTLTSGSNVTTTLYINGTQDLTATATNHSNLSDLQNGLTIGYWTASGNQYNFNGKIDETSIFNYTLSSNQILEIYNNGKPNDISALSPISWWRLGDSSYANSSNYYVFPNKIANAPDGIGNAAYKPSISADAPKVVAPGVSSGLVELDKKGDTPNSTSNAISYNILKTDQSVYTPGYVSQYTVDNNYSMAFDGVDDYFDAGNINEIEVSDFTVSLWVKFNGNQNSMMFFSGTSLSTNSTYVQRSNNDLYFGLGAQSNYIQSTPTVANNVWHHIVVVATGTSGKIYLNGSDTSASGAALSSTRTNLGQNFTIGKGLQTNGSNGFFLGGQIDEFAVFNKALTADQIKFDIYEASATANKSADFINNPNLPTPVVWYRMGD